MNPSDRRTYCFGPFCCGCEQRLLFRESETAPLAPKVGETLRVLLERHETVVEKAGPMREAWSGADGEGLPYAAAGEIALYGPVNAGSGNALHPFRLRARRNL